MDPKSKIDTKKAPAATVHAVLMSPDPYMPSNGEKTLHRLNFGSGDNGRKKIELLKKYIEDVQGWKKDASTGVVTTCPNRRYHSFSSNCGDFVKEIEEYAETSLGGKLVKVSEDSIWLPGRRYVEAKNSLLKDFSLNIWNRSILFLVDGLIFLCLNIPWLAVKLGAKVSDLPELNDHTHPDKISLAALLKLQHFAYKPKSIHFPIKVRLNQLYSPRLKDFSAKVKS